MTSSQETVRAESPALQEEETQETMPSTALESGGKNHLGTSAKLVELDEHKVDRLCSLPRQDPPGMMKCCHVCAYTYLKWFHTHA